MNVPKSRSQAFLLLAASGMIGCLASCAEENTGASQDTPVRTDSAGVEVITNVRPAWSAGGGWQVEPEPTLQIGSPDGSPEDVLHGIVAVRALGDSVLVAQQTEIRVYAPDGRLVRSMGRAGHGPGEFSRLVDVVSCAHGLVASDLSPPRLTQFAPSGGIATVDLPQPATPGLLSPLQPLLACTAAGVLDGLSGAMSRSANPSEIVRPTAFVVQASVTGTAIDTLFTYLGRETSSGLAVPFGQATTLAGSDSLFYVADTGTPEFRIYGLDGSLRRTVRIPYTERSVTTDDIARLREVYLEDLSPSMTAEIGTRFDSTSSSTELPGASGPGTMLRNPWPDDPLWMPTADGRSLIIVERRAAVGDEEASFRVMRIDLSGDTVVNRLHTYDPLPISDQLLDEAYRGQAERVARLQGVTPAAAEAAVRRALVLPSFHPPVSEVVPGRDGTVWLRREDDEAGIVQWLVLDASGRAIGRIILPDALQLHAAERGRLWGIVRDALEFPMSRSIGCGVNDAEFVAR